MLITAHTYRTAVGVGLPVDSLNPDNGMQLRFNMLFPILYLNF